MVNFTVNCMVNSNYLVFENELEFIPMVDITATLCSNKTSLAGGHVAPGLDVVVPDDLGPLNSGVGGHETGP